VIEIRPADVSDAADVQRLLAQLGYEMPTEVVRARLAELAQSRNDPVLLALERGRELGLIALHWASMLHIAKPVAQITALVVCDEARRRGIGRTLVDRGAELARQAGCQVLELTTALRRTDAQAFYVALGFKASSVKFRRALD
jgi:GNAT superfamily N-acetyltransferase